jgi:trehalose 6-phosphate phosphatase
MHGSYDSLESLRAAARRHVRDPLLVVASFDGVLAEYEDDPAAVRIDWNRQQTLSRLERLPGVTVAVMSGRPLDDLKARVDLGDDVFYIGLHGLEIAGPAFTSTPGETLQPYYESMRHIAADLHDVISRVPGVRLEWKGPIIAVHTRHAASEDAVWSRFRLLSAAADLVNAGTVQTVRGRDVLELVPNVGCSPGDALLTIRRRLEAEQQRRVFTMYLGADGLDDSALSAVGSGGVAAVVGRRTRAEYHLQSQAEVDALLNHVIEDRQYGPAAPAR